MTEPIKPYDPDTVGLRTKIERHLRRKGWKKQNGAWLNPSTGKPHTLTAAVKWQLFSEGYV